MTVQQSYDSNLEESLVREIFPSFQENYRSVVYITERAILASRSEFVDNLNEMMIGKFPGEIKTYISAERKYAHHDAEKSRSVKWFVQWDTINLYRF
ncbi:hypothetical protein H5410_015223 [Solanum commersonii]|uniref:ATP-dependent DNA helicase n=1 Tax=Solanum commersonii TaxID=4109 RepID=A0A9J5ZTU2_SOLCO|nr:hypothetical protein H5410_015223 [Solanum commersonii]